MIMADQMKSIMELNPLHWLLAYGGLIVHILTKLSEIEGDFFAGISRKSTLTTISSIVLIPIILIICTDTSMKDILPINYATSFLLGYQTQSFVQVISKFNKNKKDENS